MSKEATKRRGGGEFARPGPAAAVRDPGPGATGEGPREQAPAAVRTVTIELCLREPIGHIAERIPQSTPLTARQKQALGLVHYGCMGQPKRSAPANVESATDALRYLLDLVADAAGIA